MQEEGLGAPTSVPSPACLSHCSSLPGPSSGKQAPAVGSRKVDVTAVLSLGLDLGHGFLQFGVSHGEAQAGCSLGPWEIPAGLGGEWDRAQRLLWSHFVDTVFSLCSSYLHCKWATLEELEKDPRISQKIKRFRNKQAQMKHIFTEVRAEHSKELCPTPAHPA